MENSLLRYQQQISLDLFSRGLNGYFKTKVNENAFYFKENPPGFNFVVGSAATLRCSTSSLKPEKIFNKNWSQKRNELYNFLT